MTKKSKTPKKRKNVVVSNGPFVNPHPTGLPPEPTAIIPPKIVSINGITGWDDNKK